MQHLQEDPLVTSSRREAVVAFVLWAVAMLWTVGYCYRYGYQRSPEDVQLIGGIPSWVLWGIFVPWVLWTIISTLFARFVMRDEVMDEERDDEADITSGSPSTEASHG